MLRVTRANGEKEEISYTEMRHLTKDAECVGVDNEENGDIFRFVAKDGTSFNIFQSFSEAV